MSQPVAKPPADKAIQAPETWCLTCCTMHDSDARCPGELLASGVERHGWRVQVENRFGVQIFGTLLAPVGNRWRARILTYPKILWIVPRGGTMKFLGKTPAEAEKQAIEYIERHCEVNDFQMKPQVPAAESEAVDHEQDADTAASPQVQASQRELRTIPVRYGQGRLTHEAETEDLSQGGLFIRTDEPLAAGSQLQMQLEIDGLGIPLRGVVQWIREKPESGRHPGMGIKLQQPHPRYVHYVRQQVVAQAPDEG